MSKATIVSIMPFAFNREIIGHNPHYYSIPACKKNEINTLVIEDATSWLYIGEGKSIPRRHLAIEEATELVDTFLAANMFVTESAQPGITYLEGAFSPEEIEEDHPELLQALRDKQNAWFKILVDKADDEWNKFHQHRGISDPQRLAATWLGLKREWNVVIEKGQNYQECRACGSTIKANISVCPNCKLILKENPDFQFAS